MRASIIVGVAVVAIALWVYSGGWQSSTSTSGGGGGNLALTIRSKAPLITVLTKQLQRNSLRKVVADMGRRESLKSHAVVLMLYSTMISLNPMAGYR
jgi:hypothetical protein